MAEDADVGEGDGDDKMIKRSPFCKKPNVPMEYPTYPRFDKS